MSLKQIVIEYGTKAESLTFQTVDKHLLLRDSTRSPLHLLYDGEEEIHILDTILTIVPPRHGVVLRRPGARCHHQERVTRLVSHSVIRSHVSPVILARHIGDIGQAVVGVDQQTMCIRGLLRHVFRLTVVFIGRLEHVIARAESEETN